MTQLLIAEKPSVAKDIAAVVKATRRHNGFIEGQGWIITWCIGHLVELIEPHEYDPAWKPWRMDLLPMVPERFKLRPVSSTADQLQIVMGLLRRSDVSAVVNACDAGREGELIFRYVYELARATVPIRRLWISSMTEDAIRDGLAHLRPGADFDALAAAARCRSEADWLVGLNATRAITVRSRQGQPYRPDAPLYSVGRVQTPTLAILVNRELEIRNFKPEDYWQLEATFENTKGRWVGRWFSTRLEGGESSVVDRFSRLEDALAVQSKVDGSLGSVLEVEQKRTREAPPQLFDLTRLQRTANKRYGFSASYTLTLAQALYERHKLLTYPRTDSLHLSTDLVPKLKPTISAVRVPPYVPFADRLLALEKLPISKRFVDDSKVSDHHAIIPTTSTPRLSSLSEDERKIYDLVVRRFLGVFFPDALFDRTRVVTGVEGETFVTRGRVLVDPGWREVAGFKDDEPKKRRAQEDDSDKEGEDEDEQGVLPPLKKKDPAQVEAVELLEKQTQPPPRFTEATLLAAMETAGRRVEEEELARAMKDRGLGTPATRAAIIETLLVRGFVVRRGKVLLPLEKGIRLIAAVPVESLKSPLLTGEWEARLARMARSEHDAEAFRAEVVGYIHDVVSKIKRSQPIALQVEAESLPELPVDDPQQGDSAAEGTGVASRQSKAGRGAAKAADGAVGDRKPARARKPKNSAQTDTSASERTTRKKPPSAKATSSTRRKGGTGSAVAMHLPAEAPEAENAEALGQCPGCGGPIHASDEGYSCPHPSSARCFRIRREIAGNPVTLAMVRSLLAGGRTRVARGFVSPKSGISFSARLFWKPEGGIGFEFVDAPLSTPLEGASSDPSGTVSPAVRKKGARRSRTAAEANPEDAPHQDEPLRASAAPAPGPAVADKGASKTADTGGMPLTPAHADAGLNSLSASRGANPVQKAAPRRLSAQAMPAERPPAPPLPVAHATEAAGIHAPRMSGGGGHGAVASDSWMDQVTSPIGVALGVCPCCRKGEVIAGKRAWGCSRWREGCGFVLPFLMAGRELSEGEARRLLTQGRLGPLRGLNIEGGTGTLVLKQGKVELVSGSG